MNFAVLMELGIVAVAAMGMSIQSRVYRADLDKKQEELDVLFYKTKNLEEKLRLKDLQQEAIKKIFKDSAAFLEGKLAEEKAKNWENTEAYAILLRRKGDIKGITHLAALAPSQEEAIKVAHTEISERGGEDFYRAQVYRCLTGSVQLVWDNCGKQEDHHQRRLDAMMAAASRKELETLLADLIMEHNIPVTDRIRKFFGHGHVPGQQNLPFIHIDGGKAKPAPTSADPLAEGEMRCGSGEHCLDCIPKTCNNPVKTCKHGVRECHLCFECEKERVAHSEVVELF